MENKTFIKNDIKADVIFDYEKRTVWMSQKEIAKLYSKTRPRITQIINVLQHNYTNFESVCEENLQTASDGKTYKIVIYNLDIIREIGFKINLNLTNEFCGWCETIINQENNQIIPIESNIIRFNNGSVSLDVTIEPQEDTVYLSKEQLIILFDTTRQNIEYHIENIYNTNELDRGATCKEILQVQKEEV